MTNVPPPSVAGFDADLVRRYDVPAPRYTSYPTAAHFRAMTSDEHRQAVEACVRARPDAPLSLYVHLPFCASPCFYCGCTRVITRDRPRTTRYLQLLLHEIRLQSLAFGGTRPIEQLHLGGGTPTHFADEELGELLECIRARFGFAAQAQREFSIEIDPRTVDPPRLERLADLGFNRISLGVQDFDADVQAAVNRVQDRARIAELVAAARCRGLRSVSFDLIYGLPRQTEASFARTLDHAIAMRPDRLAIYGYAHLPSMFRAQRKIRLDDLPDAAQRLALLALAIERLTQAGYVHLGLDHFALPGDDLAIAFREGRMQRNFQGYSTRAGLDLLGVGMSAISRLGDVYTQDERVLAKWEARVAEEGIATARGIRLTDEDRRRARIIEDILCGRDVRYSDHQAPDEDFRRRFAAELARLEGPRADGLVELLPDRLHVTREGRFLLRVIAMAFDAWCGAAGALPHSRAA
ncbi:MAG TPA: oxygen-independent coproporphyrinogen III oxidase [Nevskiaceae bacterium]|nr:oxygen-independent coproporphyrinogen III oxidase [Nevskiaceae bacterium]